MFDALSQDEVDALFGSKKDSAASKQESSEDSGVQLSQDEIDRLVNSHNKGENLGPKPEVRLEKHDFKRVNAVTKKELKEFRVLSDQFCVDLSEYFSGKTNRAILFETADVSQMTREEFGYRIPHPTFFASGKFFNKPLLLQSDVSVVQRGILLRDVGATKILDFDQELFKFAVVKPMLACLYKRVDVIKNNKNLKFDEDQIEDPVCVKPENCTDIPLYEMGVVFTIRVKAGNQEGLFNVFSSKSLVTVLINKGIIQKDEAKEAKIKMSKTDCIVSVGGSWSNYEDELKSGLTIPIDRKAGDDVDLIKDGKVIAKGNIVVMEGEALGFNITKIIK